MDPSDDSSASSGSPDYRLELAVALFVLALGATYFVGALAVQAGSAYDRIGPRLFPYVVSIGLALSGLFLLRPAIRNARNAVSRGGASFGAGVPSVLLALVATVFLLESAGFVPSASLLFWLVARAFESGRPLRDALVGVLLATLAYVAFNLGLGLALPAGVLLGWL